MVAKAIGETVDLDKVLVKMKDLLLPDGLFKSSSDQKKSANILNTKIVLELLALFPNENTRSAYKEIAEAVFNLLPTGDDDIIVDPTLLSPLSRISSKKPVASQVVSVARSLLALRYTNDLETLAKVLESLRVITLYKVQPLYVGLSNAVFGIDDPKISTIQVFNVLGNVVQSDQITVVAVKMLGHDNSVFQGALTDSVLDLSSASIDVGSYVVDLAITLADRKKPLIVHKPIVVQGKLAIQRVYVGVSDSMKVDSSELQDVKTQNALTGMRASAAEGESIHVHFSILGPKAGPKKKSLRPHQAFLKFTHLDSGLNTFMVATPSGENQYKVGVSLTTETETFLYKSGEYTLTLLIADPLLADSIEWILGSALLTFPSKVVKDSPLYSKSLQHDSDNTLTALPEISHVMRLADERASDGMATVFTALSLLPLVVFLWYIRSLAPSLTIKSPIQIAFVAIVATILLLYVAYWLALPGVSFYDTIKYICILAPLAVVIGRAALGGAAEVGVKNK